MLQVENAHAGYGKGMVLNDLNLEVRKGELLGLLGRNGAGKTTTLKMIIGELPVKRGVVRLGDVDLTNLKIHERIHNGIAYVPQGRHIFPSLSVRNNIRVAAHGARRQSWREAVEEMFEEFPILADKCEQPGGQLSGGQQQILALARALVSSPQLILLDEPSEGLQPSIVTQIGQVIHDLCLNRGITILLVEQNLDFVTDLATRVCVMENGQIVLSESPAEVKANKQIQQKYLGL